MITFLVVGRNDGYGINLHKRTAISLNYLATLCREADDEIVYVDCNTPAYDLTLVEAIADTLTPQAKTYLRVYRISKEQMHGAIGETPLPFSDELSRNVGIRRSNPKNKWILSTNCDILIQPIGNTTLQGILSELTPRFYVCPRVGVPMAQWQMLDRMDINQISGFCDEVIKQGFRFSPEKDQPWLRFSSVGDFQLALREHWFQIRGCEEGMKFWGHSDANNSKRLSILNGGGRTPDLGGFLRVLHLDHNPTVQVSHEKTLVHNDWKKWVEDVTDFRSQNGENWGLADLELPVIRLDVKGGGSAKEILKSHRRERNFLRSMQVKLQAKFWQKASSVANWLERKSSQS